MKENKCFTSNEQQPYKMTLEKKRLSYEELLKLEKQPSDSIKVTNENIKVFVPAQALVNDEYEGGDMYIGNINHPFHKRRINVTLELIRKILSDHQGIVKVLDAGCGKGYITDKIANENERLEVSGCDYSYTAIRYASFNFEKVDFCVADVHNLPYKCGYFDIVVLNNVFGHIPDIANVIKKISDVLNENGYMIISTPSRYRIENICRKLNHCEFKMKSKMHITEYSIGQVEEIMKWNGYSLIECTTTILEEKDRKERKLKKILTLLTSGYIDPIQWESTLFFLFKKNKKVCKEN